MSCWTEDFLNRVTLSLEVVLIRVGLDLDGDLQLGFQLVVGQEGETHPWLPFENEGYITLKVGSSAGIST